MQNAGALQYGQGGTPSQESPYEAIQVQNCTPNPTTASLRQFRKKDNVEKVSATSTTGSNPTGEHNSSHVARVAPHAHYPTQHKQNDFYRYPAQYQDYGSPYKEHSPVKYSEIAEVSPQMHHLEAPHVQQVLPKHKEMCNIQQGLQQAYLPPSDMSMHHQQYMQKEQTAQMAYKSPEAQYLHKDQHYSQFSQMSKYGLPSQHRKYAAGPTHPSDNSYLSLQRISSDHRMSRSLIPPEHHIRELPTDYSPLDQTARMYAAQNQRFFPSANHSAYANYPRPVPTVQQQYPDYRSCNYPRSQMNPQMRYMERSVSPSAHRPYPDVNYLPAQKLAPSYANYPNAAYAQHYQQHRRPNPTMHQNYYPAPHQQPQVRAPQYTVPSHHLPHHHQMAQDEGHVTASNTIRQYIENWAEEEPTSEIETAKYVYKDQLRGDETNEVFVINASEIPQYIEGGVPLVASEDGQYVFKSNVSIDNTGAIKILDKPLDNSVENPERVVSLHIVESGKNDCLLNNRPINQDVPNSQGSINLIAANNHNACLHQNYNAPYVPAGRVNLIQHPTVAQQPYDNQKPEITEKIEREYPAKIEVVPFQNPHSCIVAPTNQRLHFDEALLDATTISKEIETKEPSEQINENEANAELDKIVEDTLTSSNIDIPMETACDTTNPDTKVPNYYDKIKESTLENEEVMDLRKTSKDHPDSSFCDDANMSNIPIFDLDETSSKCNESEDKNDPKIAVKHMPLIDEEAKEKELPKHDVIDDNQTKDNQETEKKPEEFETKDVKETIIEEEAVNSEAKASEMSTLPLEDQKVEDKVSSESNLEENLTNIVVEPSKTPPIEMEYPPRPNTVPKDYSKNKRKDVEDENEKTEGPRKKRLFSVDDIINRIGQNHQFRRYSSPLVNCDLEVSDGSMETPDTAEKDEQKGKEIAETNELKKNDKICIVSCHILSPSKIKENISDPTKSEVSQETMESSEAKSEEISSEITKISEEIPEENTNKSDGIKAESTSEQFPEERNEEKLPENKKNVDEDKTTFEKLSKEEIPTKNTTTSVAELNSEEKIEKTPLEAKTIEEIKVKSDNEHFPEEETLTDDTKPDQTDLEHISEEKIKEKLTKNDKINMIFSEEKIEERPIEQSNENKDNNLMSLKIEEPAKIAMEEKNNEENDLINHEIKDTAEPSVKDKKNEEKFIENSLETESPDELVQIECEIKNSEVIEEIKLEKNVETSSSETPEPKEKPKPDDTIQTTKEELTIAKNEEKSVAESPDIQAKTEPLCRRTKRTLSQKSNEMIEDLQNEIDRLDFDEELRDEIKIDDPALEQEFLAEEDTPSNVVSTNNKITETEIKEDEVKPENEDVEYRSVIKIEENSIILHIAGELVEITVNQIDGQKIIKVVPMSSTTTVDFNDNYDIDRSLLVDPPEGNSEEILTFDVGKEEIIDETEELIVEEIGTIKEERPVLYTKAAKKLYEDNINPVVSVKKKSKKIVEKPRNILKRKKESKIPSKELTKRKKMRKEKIRVKVNNYVPNNEENDGKNLNLADDKSVKISATKEEIVDKLEVKEKVVKDLEFNKEQNIDKGNKIKDDGEIKSENLNKISSEVKAKPADKSIKIADNPKKKLSIQEYNNRKRKTSENTKPEIEDKRPKVPVSDTVSQKKLSKQERNTIYSDVTGNLTNLKDPRRRMSLTEKELTSTNNHQVDLKTTNERVPHSVLKSDQIVNKIPLDKQKTEIKLEKQTTQIKNVENNDVAPKNVPKRKVSFDENKPTVINSEEKEVCEVTSTSHFEEEKQTKNSIDEKLTKKLNNWEELSNSPKNSMTDGLDSYIDNKPKPNLKNLKTKCIIDINDFDTTLINNELSSPSSTSNIKNYTENLRNYKAEVDSKLNSLDIKLKVNKINPRLSNYEDLLIKRFLNKEPLNFEEFARIKQIIYLKKKMQQMSNRKKTEIKPFENPKAFESEKYEIEMHDLKLHLKKIANVRTYRKKRRFRNLYADSSSDDSSGNFESKEPVGEFSVRDGGSRADSLKLIFKRKTDDSVNVLQPVVRLQREAFIESMAESLKK